VNGSVPAIDVLGLSIAFIPALLVIGVMYRWSSGAGTALYATVRMLVQLLLIGYVLIFVFETDRIAVVAVVLAIMLVVASAIAVRTLNDREPRHYFRALIAISVGGLLTLALVTAGVLRVEPWFAPRYVVPLAGMTIAGAMNAVSLAAERFEAERGRGESAVDARRKAIQAALIPVVNSLFAVGLVSLPGMMTGQVLSGVSPLVAAKYQIVVMTMLLGAAGLAAATYLKLEGRRG
jgi:putative ABC transport system permease protein